MRIVKYSQTNTFRNTNPTSRASIEQCRQLFRSTSAIFCIFKETSDQKSHVSERQKANDRESIKCIPIALHYSFHGSTASSEPGLLIVEVSRTHWNTTLSRNPLDDDRPVRESSTWQQTTLTRDRYPCPLWDSNPQFQETNGCRVPPCIFGMVVENKFFILCYILV
jgi:hypothetical protein